MRNITVQSVQAKYTSLQAVLDERARRLWAAAEARAIGRGGITQVAEVTGLSRVTIRAGLSELDLPAIPTDRGTANQRLRRPGGGRKPLAGHDPGLLRDLEALVDPVTRGDPMSPLRWTCKSVAKLATELRGQGHVASERTVNGVPQSAEQKRTLSRADSQVVAVLGMMQRPQLTLSDAVGQRERVAPQDVDVLVAQR